MITNEVEAVGEPGGDVGGAVVGDGEAHRREGDGVLAVVGRQRRDVGRRDVEQRRDAELAEPRATRRVRAVAEEQPRQQLDRVAVLHPP